MKKILIFMVILSTLLIASNNQKSEKEKRLEKQLILNMAEEKKFAQEQTFYRQDNYNFQGAEVNRDSLDSVPDIEVDDFNMDSVYD